MIQRILKILTWIGIAAWFVVILGFVSGEADEVICKRIEVILSGGCCGHKDMIASSRRRSTMGTLACRGIRIAQPE